MIEIAEGKFPYQLWATPFEQLKQVRSDSLAMGDSPFHAKVLQRWVLAKLKTEYAGGDGSCSKSYSWTILGLLQRLHLNLPEQEGGGPCLLLSAAQACIPQLKQGDGSQRLYQGDP